uniref:NTR domain-containing protein n=1 Tax=Panagrellus redivivus TaxID=6233 RepID=A0A7E4VU65_PANRE
MSSFYFGILVFIGAVTVSVYGCRCSSAPTQQGTYCNAAWITRSRINARNNLGTNIEYIVSHQDVYKNNTALIPNRIFTASSTAACGVPDLQVGQTYLLAGTLNGNTGAWQLQSCLYMPSNDLQPGGSPPAWNNVPGDLQSRLNMQNFAACPVG